ncbi:MAG: response regulator [Actinomycetota bacterium]
MTKKILVIDDEPDLRLLVRLILESAGYEIVEAATGEEGLDLMTDERPRLVLLDIRLPGIDGWEVLERMRVDHGGDIPVIIMSAHSSPRTLEKAKEHGTQGYLVKPFKEAELLRYARQFV